jgi:hypothetical protein
VTRQPEDDIPDVHFINRVAEIAVLTDNRVVPVVHWFGRMGEDCTPDKAVACVAGSDNIGWYTVDLVEQDYAVVH